MIYRKIMVVFTTLMLTLVFTTGDAFAKGSTSSGSRSSGSTSSGTRSSSSGSTSGRTTKAPTSSGTRTTTRTQTTTRPTTATTARRTQAPATTVRSTTARTTRAPGGTGTRVVKSTVRNTTQPTAGKIAISKNTVAGGKVYTVPGTNYRYSYNRAKYSQYQNRYNGGYPTAGSRQYFVMINDPFYLPNYSLVGSPWYGHPTPVGYRIHDGQLIAEKKDNGFPWVGFFVCLLVLAAVGAGCVYFVRRSRNKQVDTPYGL